MILASLCYLQRGGKVLMLNHQNKSDQHYNDKWNGVGGKFEEGESPEECTIREVEEETGLKVKEIKLAGILTFPKMSKGKDWYVFVFTTNKFTGTIKNSQEGKLKWFAKKEVLKLNLWEGDHIFLPLVFKNKFFSGKFEYVNGKIKSYKLSTY